MKTLLRLALVSLCGAAGIMLALQVAEFRPAETAAVAASSIPVAVPSAPAEPGVAEKTAKPQAVEIVADAKPAAALVQPKLEIHEAPAAPPPASAAAGSSTSST